MKLSAHFTLEELTRSDWADRHGVDNTPPPHVIENLKRLARALDEVRVVLGRPVLINSGYRSPAVNAGIGSKARHSRHLDGLAADFRAPEYGSPMDICLEIQASHIEFDQLIFEHTWVHFGLAPLNEMPRHQVLTLQRDGTYALGLHERKAA